MSHITNCHILLHSSPKLVCSYNPPATLIGSIAALKVARRSARCNLASHSLIEIKPIARRSADYPANAWDYDFLESLSTQDSKMDKYEEEREKMIAEVKQMLYDSSMDALSRLELVDAIDSLGLKRLFQDEIKASVDIVYRDDSGKDDDDGVE